MANKIFTWTKIYFAMCNQNIGVNNSFFEEKRKKKKQIVQKRSTIDHVFYDFKILDSFKKNNVAG